MRAFRPLLVANRMISQVLGVGFKQHPFNLGERGFPYGCHTGGRKRGTNITPKRILELSTLSRGQGCARVVF